MDDVARALAPVTRIEDLYAIADEWKAACITAKAERGVPGVLRCHGGRAVRVVDVSVRQLCYDLRIANRRRVPRPVTQKVPAVTAPVTRHLMLASGTPVVARAPQLKITPIVMAVEVGARHGVAAAMLSLVYYFNRESTRKINDHARRARTTLINNLLSAQQRYAETERGNVQLMALHTYCSHLHRLLHPQRISTKKMLIVPVLASYDSWSGMRRLWEFISLVPGVCVVLSAEIP